MNKKQLILVWMMGILLLSGCATVQQFGCPKGSVLSQCSYCKSFCCSKPEIPSGACCSCGALLYTQQAIELYNSTQARVKAEQTVFGGVCDRCGRKFTFSQANVDDGASIACPFCSQPQDLIMANKRYNYDRRREGFEDLKRQVAVDDMKREIRRQNTDRSLEVTVH